MGFAMGGGHHAIGGRPCIGGSHIVYFLNQSQANIPLNTAPLPALDPFPEPPLNNQFNSLGKFSEE
jgi:hypothetical protein